MKFIHIPYPRPTLRQYFWIALLTAFAVSFTLIVFQPFGTARFRHPNKNLILAGYSFCVFITLGIYYFLSSQVFHKSKEERWTIVREAVELFMATLLSLLACYIYSVEIFGRNYSLGGMLYFLGIAASVALLPVMVCLAYLYSNWKDVSRSSIQPKTENEAEESLVLLLGNQKNEQIKAQATDIILAQAQNNYVMIYVEKEGKIQRHIIRSTLKNLKEQLPENIFLQAHRSYLVNRSSIKNLLGNKSKAHLELASVDKKIPISRTTYDLLKDKYN